MIIDWNVVVPIITQVIVFAFILGRYKAMFDYQNKVLERHEKILDKHENAIDKILERLDAMSTDIGFIKGCMAK
jgi:hypothetical protein